MRKDAGASQTQLARVLFMHPMTISKIERGIIKPFDLRLRLEETMINSGYAESMLKNIKQARGEQ